jgi:hypothetical protein
MREMINEVFGLGQATEVRGPSHTASKEGGSRHCVGENGERMSEERGMAGERERERWREKHKERSGEFPRDKIILRWWKDQMGELPARNTQEIVRCRHPRVERAQIFYMVICYYLLLNYSGNVSA